MGMDTDPAAGWTGAEARFDRLYTDHGRALLAYALRRTSDPQDAADVVGETFLIAWRRLQDIPPDEAARLWLYGVARRVLANQERSERRRQRLAERLARELPTALHVLPDPASETGVIWATLAGLGPADQEILRLAGWEQLTPAQIATVLQISPLAARSRLHRARRRFKAALRRAPERDDLGPSRLKEAL
jgi:RNA polymerase sigma factor (sigma-70 family)